MKLRPLSVAIALALLTIFPFQATEQYPARILRSISRSSDFHPSQASTFQFEMLQALGGVLSQTQALLADHGGDGTFSVTLDLDGGAYPGYVTVSHMETRTQYPIEYSDLVPMALFVDAGATSLYTLWNEGRLPEGFLLKAGFLAHHIRGHLALEFDGTRYADALYFIDRCNSCLGYRDMPVDVNLEKELWKSAEGQSGSSYLNADLTLPFRFRVVDGRADLTGGIARFNWSTGSTVSVSARPLLSVLASHARDSLRSVSDLQLLARLNADAVQRLRDTATAVDDAAQRSVDAGFFLFETLALLRTAKADAPDEWVKFMRQLSSDALVESGPAPWDRHTRSVCAVYPSEPECLN